MEEEDFNKDDLWSFNESRRKWLMEKRDKSVAKSLFVLEKSGHKFSKTKIENIYDIEYFGVATKISLKTFTLKKPNEAKYKLKKRQKLITLRCKIKEGVHAGKTIKQVIDEQPFFLKILNNKTDMFFSNEVYLYSISENKQQ